MRWSTVASCLGAILITTAYSTPAFASPIYTVATFDVPGATFIDVTGINNVGQIVGTFAGADGKRKGLIDAVATSTISTFQLPPDNPYGTFAQGINDAGQIVGYNGFFASYLRDPVTGGVTSVTSPGLLSLQARGINDSGLILGQYYASYAVLTERGAVLDPNSGRVTILSAFSDTNATFPSGINDLGQVVGSFDDISHRSFRPQGFFWDPTTGIYTVFNYPNATGLTFLTGINDVGQVVGEYQDSDYTPHGFLLDLATGTYTTLSFVGADINNAGQIVGNVSDSAGVHGFIATPQTTSVPEPVGLLVLGTGLLGYGVARRRTN